MELNITTVSGNEDRIIYDSSNTQSSPTLDYVRKSLNDEQMKWLKEIPFSAAHDDFFLFHGTPQNDTEYLLLDVRETGVFLRDTEAIEYKLQSIKQKAILCGHDHTPNSVLLSDGRMVINPGSVGLQAYTDDLPYRHKIETGSPYVRYSVISGFGDNLMIENITVPYDWEAASEIAGRNGRADWAEWVKSGRAKLDW
jgi:predicted phosphodiesterase